MPLLIPFVAAMGRALAMALIQTVASVSIFWALEKVFDILQNAVRRVFEIDESDATAVVANYIIDALLLIGTNAVVIQSRLPVRFADKLGLTTGKLRRRPISPKAAEKINKNKNSAWAKITSADIASVFAVLMIWPALSFIIKIITDLIYKKPRAVEEDNKVLKELAPEDKYQFPVGPAIPEGYIIDPEKGLIPIQKIEEKIAPGPPAPAFKVFTGVIQQGTLGAPVQLVTRETDLISGHDDLQAAAQVNIGQFWTALPARILYELKIVPSVVNKDGTIRRGESHSVITGYRADGTPRRKTITNKFAVVDVFVFTARNVRVKIDRIILGPVDALSFRPSQIQLDDFAKKLPNIVLTRDTDEIAVVMSNTPTLALPQVPEPPTPPQAPPPSPVAVEIRPTPAPQVPVAAPSAPPVAPPPAPPSPPAVPVAPTVAIPTSLNPNRCAAQSIAEFFDPEKVKYPSIAIRAEHYEQYGFGPAAWYTGTAEQNARLLAAYKKQIGCA